MRIAIYVQDMRASGVSRAMAAMARTFAQRGDEVVLVAGYAAGFLTAQDAAPAGFEAARDTPRGPLPRLTVVPPLRALLLRLRPDVILSGGNFGHFSVWAATRGTGLPVVTVFSNAMERAGQPWRNRWRRFWSGVLLRDTAGAILVGGDLARSRLFAPHLASGKATLIPNGIDLATIPPVSGLEGEPVPEPMQGPEPVILTIGRLVPQKNLEGLIEAVALARRARPLRLVILGAGEERYRQSLIARAAELGISEAVTFAGLTDNVYPWLRAARVFALASRWEGSSIALLEAMAVGVPIVASRHAGDAASVLADGRYGALADGADPADFAAALLRQIDDPVLPGERVRDYDAAAMTRAYRAWLEVAVERAGRRKAGRAPVRA